MCMGVPLRLTHAEGIVGRAEEAGAKVLVDLSLVPEARAGDWVLVFLGTAHEILTPDRAAQIAAALDGLRSVMAGGDLGDAFADLEARPPSLPPHLQAALAAGRKTG